jgi:hypothetical protein
MIDGVWAPAGGEAAQGLWLQLHLRLLFCCAVWAQPVCVAGLCLSPAVMVAAAAAIIARAIRRLDWLRVTASLPDAAVLPSWCVIGQNFSAHTG